MQRLVKKVLLIGICSIYLLAITGCSSGGGDGGTLPTNTRIPETVVYLSADHKQIIAVADDASAAPQVLSGTPFNEITAFAVSPDGQYVAYVADETISGRLDLYVRLIKGTGSTLVSTGLNAFSDVVDFAWAPDSKSLAYRVDLALDGRLQLFRVNADGSNLYEISNLDGFINSAFVSELYTWSPDSKYIAYVIDDPIYVKIALYIHDAVAAVRDSSLTYLVSDQRNEEIVALKFSPDSQSLAFRSDDLLGGDQYEILVIPSDLSSNAVRANGATGATVQIDQFEWSPDSRFLGESVIGYPNTAVQVGINTYELATSSSNRALTTSNFGTIRWAQASNRLAFIADDQLHVHDADTSSTIQISHTLAAGESLDRDAFSWSPDDSRIAYISDVTGSDSLYISPSDGSSAPIQAVGTNGFSLGSLAWSGNSAGLGFLERDIGGAFHPGNWYIYDAQGNLAWVSQSIFTFESSQVMKWSSDNMRAVYSLAGSTSSSDNLESVSTSGTSIPLSPGDVTTDPVFEYPAVGL